MKIVSSDNVLTLCEQLVKNLSNKTVFSICVIIMVVPRVRRCYIVTSLVYVPFLFFSVNFPIFLADLIKL